MKYILASNLHHKEVSGGYHGVYNPLKNHTILFFDSETYNSLSKLFSSPKDIKDVQDIEPSTIEKLIENKFLIPENQTSPVKSFAKNLPKEPKFALMYMLLTNNCNLRCDYCFERGNETDSSEKINMSQQTAFNAIDFFSKIVDKNTKGGHRVIFYGGEPFMNRDVFEDSVRRLRDYERNGKFKDLTMIVNTNGSVVDDSLAQFCADYIVNPAISIDGTKEVHDSVRKGSFSSFEGAVRGYKIFKKHNIDPGISCTISAKNIENLEDMARFLADELEPNGIGFNFLLDFKCGQNPLSISIEKSTKKLLEVFELLRGKGIYEERLMRRIGKIVDNKIHLKDCAGYGHQVVVGPNGSLGPCQVFLDAGEFIVGNVNNNIPNVRKHPVFLEWNRRTAFEMEECEDCSSIALCGGGCAYNAYVTKGSIWEKDERMCKHCNILIDWIIDDIWKRKNAQSNF